MVPHSDNDTRWLSWTGMETQLIFVKGIDLPGFASFPLLDTEDGRATIRGYFRDQIAVAGETGCGACLESLTWIANADRSAGLGYGLDDLVRVNREAIAFLEEIETTVPLCLSAQIGPRGDGYAAGEMTAEKARDYHLAQMEVLADTGCDLLSAFTIGSVDEATGMVFAAKQLGKPITIAFTIETDGRLPDGAGLAEAMDRVDQSTDGSAAYFLVNCAHPDHLQPALDRGQDWSRLNGVVANASRMSHAELDNEDELDDGNPAELGTQLGQIAKDHPHMRVFGGCCGTDTRHLRAIGQAVTA